jgi:hypothetical protein
LVLITDAAIVPHGLTTAPFRRTRDQAPMSASGGTVTRPLSLGMALKVPTGLRVPHAPSARTFIPAMVAISCASGPSMGSPQPGSSSPELEPG